MTSRSYADVVRQVMDCDITIATNEEVSTTSEGNDETKSLDSTITFICCDDITVEMSSQRFVEVFDLFDGEEIPDEIQTGYSSGSVHVVKLGLEGHFPCILEGDLQFYYSLRPRDPASIQMFRAEDNDHFVMRSIGKTVQSIIKNDNNRCGMWLPKDKELLGYISMIGIENVTSLHPVRHKYKQLWNDTVLAYRKGGISAVDYILDSFAVVGNYQSSIHLLEYRFFSDPDGLKIYQIIREAVLRRVRSAKDIASGQRKKEIIQIMSGHIVNDLCIIWGMCTEDPT